jgi:phage terminase large subunit-like protein
MAWDFACKDWWQRLQKGLAPIPDLPLDEDAAGVAVEWFNRLRLPDVIGQPLMGEAAGDWIRDFVRACFGSVEDGARQVGEALLMVPKKNAKTTNAAGIALTFMLMNKRHNADMLIIGPTQKISDLAFEQAKGMIAADEYLSKRFLVRDHKKTIEDRTNGSKLMVRTFGMDVLTGCKPVFVMIDELHILGSVSYAADVLRQVRGGMMPFPESLLVMITTQSDHPPAGVFKSELSYARGVRDGRITDGVRMLPVLYELPEDLQKSKDQRWKEPRFWKFVNPNMDRSITMDRLIEGFKRATHDGKHELTAWATQHINVEVGLALHSNRWRGADYWERSGVPGLTLDALLERSEVVVLGIDGGGLDDLLGLAVMGRDKRTRQWLHWGHAWCHPVVLEQRKDISPRLLDLQRAGELTICETPTEDVIGVADIVERIWKLGLLPAACGVGCDAWGITALVDEIVFRGVPEEMIIGVRQGAALSPAIWGVERKLNDGTFAHAAQELMAWSVGNAACEQRGNAVLITKETAGKAKIDPLVALFNAAFLMSRNPQAAVGVFEYTGM